MNMSCHTYEWNTSHIWMSHATLMNELRHTYKWVMPHIRMSHVRHTNESRHIYEYFMPHTWMSHATHVNKLHHTHGWIMPHIWMSHATHMDELHHTHGWIMPHLQTSHVTHRHSYGSRPEYKRIKSRIHIYVWCTCTFFEVPHTNKPSHTYIFMYMKIHMHHTYVHSYENTYVYEPCRLSILLQEVTSCINACINIHIYLCTKKSSHTYIFLSLSHMYIPMSQVPRTNASRHTECICIPSSCRINVCRVSMYSYESCATNGCFTTHGIHQYPILSSSHRNTERGASS